MMRSDPGVLLILGVAFVLVVCVFSAFFSWRKSRQEIRRREELAERQRKMREELAERQRKMETDALDVQNRERARLSTLIVPTIAELRSLTWQQFEDEIARMFERLDYLVQQTPYVKDGGRDAILKKGTDTFLLECKKYSEGGLSGRPDLQKFHSAIMTARAVRGFFVTCGGFTKDAMDFAATVPIELIDASKLLRYMFESKPAASRGPFDSQDLFDKPADASNPESAQDDVYSSMCQNCGDIVEHRLRTPQVATCRHGHHIKPTLDLESVLAAAGASPNCELCRSPMRLVNWKGRRFWGCVRYPSCRSTRNWIRPR